MYSYKYPRPSVAADCVIFGLDDDESLKVLLIQRKDDPHKDKWAFPGGFIEMDENLEESARRELEEETGLSDIYFEQLYTFGNVGRDPRGRVISVAYLALVNISDCKVVAGDDASAAEWIKIEELPPLAFDHNLIFDMGLKRLRGKLRYEAVGFELLPEKFTIAQLQRLYERILGEELDRRNFRKKILSFEVLTDLDELQKGVGHRAGKLYSFDKEKYFAIKDKFSL